MNYKSTVVRVGLITVSLMLVCLDIPAQAVTPHAGQVEPILEWTYTDVMGDVYRRTVRIYSDGRFVSEAEEPERAPSGKYRTVLTKEEKQLEPSEFAELTAIADQPGFQQAEANYVVVIVTDNPSWVVITYRGEGGVKKVRVGNLRVNDPAGIARIPPPVLRLARWGEYGGSLGPP